MMLKFFFWILLLGNAGLLAYQHGYFDALLPSGREPARMKQQINADKVRVIPAPAAAPEPPPEPAPEPVSAPVSEAKKPVVLACTEIGNFPPDEAKRFSAELASLSLGDRVKQRALQEVASHMVYIPPQADKEGADKKAGELRALGVEDFFIIQDNSSLRWGISLGVFRHEEAARAHLAALTRKGVRSARIGQRTVTSSQVAFQLRELDEDAKAALDKVKAGFPKQEVRACS
ncbi:SPOR domain-containing protein [Noviherbaspirillum sp.]|uniref:SPOR domain-containing protein n=1 Tax=Noviherbaspirillum sp. TaxID=1926288 RepID=UPI002D359BBD|nr:SPOR domain-containing protein [Noviherbaspirillum sp.]HZW23519.1 SPOR domain-containing protein [Noviherbaspirillum sp.]